MNRLLAHMLADPKTRREVVQAIAVLLREQAEKDRRVARLRRIQPEVPLR